MSHAPRFTTYDIVEIRSERSELKPITGKKGIIRGHSVSESPPFIHAYAVDIPATRSNWFVFENELLSTGKKASAEKVESGYFMTVKAGDFWDTVNDLHQDD